MNKNLKTLGLALSLILVTACASQSKNTTAPTHDSAHIMQDESKHVHGKNCSHKAVKHDAHFDYVHNGKFHAAHGAHWDFHGQPMNARNPAAEHAIHADHAHKHGKDCGHKTVTHASHTDYVHDNHYHADHNGHVDDHGILNKESPS